MNKSIRRIALIVGFATILSKIGGFIRQVLLAALFGIGQNYEAYNYAYIIPGFFLILVGGNNGPIHNSIVSVISRKSKKESKEISSTVITLICIISIFISIAIYIFAEPLINLIGPGLDSSVSLIAIIQLKIMAPIILLSGLLGVSCGILNSNDKFFLPTISPIFLSLSIIIGILYFWIYKINLNNSITFENRGGEILAYSTLCGVIVQFAIQYYYLLKYKLIKLKASLNFQNKGVIEVFKITIPALLSSGMLQLNVITDLFFVSSINGAASALSYANFLIQAPLGLISNSLLLPLLPTFSKLALRDDKTEFIRKINQGVNFSIISMTYLSTIFIALSIPILEIIYKRGQFDSGALNLVNSILIAYSIGLPAYLTRDLLVRIYYSMGNSRTPFKLSTLGVFLNILFDWILIGGPVYSKNIFSFNYGVPGIVFATSIVNFIICYLLLKKLDNSLSSFIYKISLRYFIITLSGLISVLSIISLRKLLELNHIIINSITEVIIFSIIGTYLFIFLCKKFKVKEIYFLLDIIKDKRNLFFGR